MLLILAILKKCFLKFRTNECFS